MNHISKFDMRCPAGFASDSQISVALHGSEIQCEDLAQQLAREGVSCILLRRRPGNFFKYLAWLAYFFRKTARCDILHLMLPTSGSCIKMAKIGRLKRMPIICHWVGSDVLRLQTKKKRDIFFRVCGDMSVKHLAISNHLIDELAEYDIHAELLKNISERIDTKVKALPKRAAVLSYWPDTRADFYGAPMVFELANRFQEISFEIVGANGTGQNAPQNVKFLGRVKDMHSVFLRTTVYVRIVPHDGGYPPRTVAEALARGRYVLYNRPCPHCEYFKTINELELKLAKLLKSKEPNLAGAEFVRKHLNREENTKKLIKIYETLVIKQ